MKYLLIGMYRYLGKLVNFIYSEKVTKIWKILLFFFQNFLVNSENSFTESRKLEFHMIFSMDFFFCSISSTLNLKTSLRRMVWLHNWSNRQMSDNFLPRAERSNFKPAKAIKEDTNQHATFFRDTPQTLVRGSSLYCRQYLLQNITFEHGLIIN